MTKILRLLSLLLVSTPVACGGATSAEINANDKEVGEGVFSAPFLGSSVQSDIRDNQDALYAGDVDTVLEYSTPQLLAKMGGAEPARQTLQAFVDQMSSSGIEVESLEFPEDPPCVGPSDALKFWTTTRS